MNNTHLKKLFTIFLSLMLSISMLPAGVFAEAANGSEEQETVVTETVDQDTDQDETPVPEQTTDVDKGGNDEGGNNTDTVVIDQESDQDTPEGQSYDFEMNGEKWVISGDKSADTEDKKTWDAMFADSKFTDNWAEDLVMVAKTQVGYKESKKNFAVSESQVRKGYSRYGAWAGEPYADWSPLFVSFCLNYAKVDMPYYKDGFDKWITDLQKKKMFADANGYVPRSGDLVFFDNDKDGEVDAAGIVESYDEEKGVIEVIEGDYEDEVAERKVKTSDPTIVGYGILPENPKASNEAKTEPEEKTGAKNETPQNANKLRKSGLANGLKASPETTHTNLDDYLGTDPALMTISVTHEDGRPITDNDPLVTGEMAVVYMEVQEDYPSMVFDMDSLTYQFPEGFSLVQPKTEYSTIYVEDYDGNPQTMVNAYTINANALLTYTWNTENPNTYELACAAKNKGFAISTSLKIDDSTTLIDFGHGITFPVDNTGKLTVTKSVTGVSSLTAAQMGAMTFRVIDKKTGQVPKDKDGNPREDCTFSLADMTGSSLANKTYDVLKLPPGEYTVEEVGRPTIDDYTFVTSSSTTTDDATVHGGQGSTVNLSNVYAQDFGKLKLRKVFGSDSDLNDRTLSDDQKDKITFEVVGPNGKISGSPFKYSQFTNGELDLGSLPVGTYTITERSTIEGYGRETTYQVNTDTAASGDEASVAIAKNDNDVVTYTNTYKEKKGHLKIKKTFSGAGADKIPDALKNDVTFRVTGPNGYDHTFTYEEFGADGVLDLGDVPIGTYKITESKADFPDYSITRTTTITDADSSSGLIATSIVTEGDEDFPKFDNSYKELGTLVITKNITGAYNNNNTYIINGTSFKVERKNSDGTWTTVYAQIKLNDTNYFKLVNGVWTCTIPNLPAGEYKVTEIPFTQSDLSERTTKVTVDGNTTTSLIGTDSVEYNQTSTIAYENNYRRYKGTIKINKKIFVDNVEIDLATATAAELEAMGLTVEKQKAMKFTVKLGNSTVATVTLWDILHPDDPEAKSNVVTVNTSTNNYTVTESGADFNDDYMRETLKALDNGTPSSGMTVSGIQIRNDGDSHTAEFTNKYKKSGSIRLFKEITGGLNSADRDKVRQQLKFKIKNKATGQYVLDTSDNDYEFTLEQITAEAGIEVPVGTYVIEELYYKYKTDEYDVTVESHLTDMSVTFGDDISPDVAVTYGFQSYVYYENRYVKGPGPGVTVEKHVILNGAPVDETVTDEEILAFENAVKDQIKFRIVSTEKDDNGKPVYDHTYTYRELEGHTVMIPPGEYTITELDYQMTGYNHNIYFKVNGQTVTSTSAKFTVTKTTPLGIEVYNGYVEIGNLVVKKTFANDSDIKANNITDAQKKEIVFTVTGYRSKTDQTVIFETQTFKYSQMTDGQKLFENIPAGYYVVTETSGNGAGLDKYTWSLDWTGESGTNDAQVIRGATEPASVTAENKYVRQKGNLRVTKTLDLPPAGLDSNRSDLPNVTFTVKNKDANTPTFNETFKYSQMTSVDANGNHYMQFNVPTGEYVVTETNADFGYYIRTSTVKVGTGSSEPYDVDTEATGTVTNNQTTNIEITNKYEEAGHLIFRKTFVDDACKTKLTDAQKRKITFTVYEEGNDTKPYAVFTYADFDSAGSKTLLVRPNTEYTVYESLADITGYARVTKVKVGTGSEATYDEQNGASAQVAVFTDKEVAFINTYEERGKLTVTKTISGINKPLTDAQKAAIQFTVLDPQGNVLKDDQGVEIGRFTFADISTGGYTGSKTFNNLPAGDYTVKETVNDSAFYSLNRTTTYKVGNGTVKPGETAENVGVTLKGQTVAFTNSYKEADKLSVKKSDGGYPKGVGFITIDGTKYPYWMFTLTIEKLTPDTTNNGVVDLTDIYDKKLTGLFRVLTNAQAQAAGIPNAVDANKLVPVGSGTAADVTLQPDYDNGKVVFHISGVNENTAATNTLTYYLVPKDADALGRLNTSDESDVSESEMSIQKKYKNVVNYKPLPGLEEVSTNEVEYMYEHTNISKECINWDKDRKVFYNPADPTGPAVNYALYECIINPDGMRIGTEDYIDVTDTFSDNQSVNLDTVVFERYDNSTTPPNITPTVTGDIENPHMEGHSLKFKLKNELAIRLTYRAQIAVSSADVGKPMEIKNTLEVAGKKVVVVPDIIPQSTGHGSVVQIKLIKHEDKNFNHRLAGAEFKLYRDLDGNQQKAKLLLNPDTTPGSGTFTTNANGEIIIKKYIEDGVEQPVVANSTHHVTYFLEEVNPPKGYKPLGYTLNCRLADVQHGETFNYEGPWYVYLPINDSMNVKNEPKDVSFSLGALKDFETNGSARTLEEGEFTFKLEAVNDAPMPAGASGGVITKSNDADGKAAFGSVKLNYEDIVTRNKSGEVTSSSKTYTYTITEQAPAGGVDEKGNKDGVHYDLAPKTVTVTISWNDTKNDFDVNVTGASLDSSNNVHFVEVDNEYTAQGIWTPKVKKDLQGRPLKAGEFTFQIKKGNDVIAEGTNNADGTVDMDPASLTFTLDDLGANTFIVHEEYTKETDDGMVTVADDETVTVTVAEKESNGKKVYDGELNVTSDKATLGNELVMVNEYRATGKWHPKAEKTMKGALKIKAGDYSFELAGVKDADGNLPPMPIGSTNGKKELACDANGKVDFGQIDFRQGKFNDVKYNDGDKVYTYTIREIKPNPPIFGVEYDDTVYTVTVTTSINKTNKLGVAVDWTPRKLGENLYDSDTAIFTAPFKNKYNPGPAKAQPEYKKTISGEKPTKKVKFEFELDKADDNTGDFDYVKVGDEPLLQPFKAQKKTLTLEPGTLTDSGLFDKITFLAEGTYKFKITETPKSIPPTPYVNGAIDERIDYDSKVYYYTVVVTGGEGLNLEAKGTYTYVDENDTVQTATIAAFTNKYTPKPVPGTVKVKKTLKNRVWTTNDSFTFKIEPIGDAPTFAPNDEITITKNDESTDYTKSFNNVEFTKAGTYTYKVTETHAGETIKGVKYDSTEKTVTIVVKDTDDGKLELVKPEGSDDTIPTAEFTNTYDAEGSIRLKGTKKYIYGSLKNETFNFSVYPEDAFNASGYARNKLAQDTDLQSVKVGIATTPSVEGDTTDFNFKFKTESGYTSDKLVYKLADIQDGSAKPTKTFKYVVVEDIPEEAVMKTVGTETFYYLYDKNTGRDVKYDLKVYHLEVVVTDNGDGTLDVNISEDSDGELESDGTTAGDGAATDGGAAADNGAAAGNGATGDTAGNGTAADTEVIRCVKFGFENKKIYTKIRLTKLIDELVDGDTESELTNVTCVFKVTYTDPILGRKVNRTVSVQFDASSASSDIAELDKIPIEATDLKVEEVYSADYTGTITSGVAKLEVDPDTNLPLNPPLWTVTFENRRKGDITGGGVINSVENNGNGFVITNRRDSTGNNPPPQQPADDFR